MRLLLVLPTACSIFLVAPLAGALFTRLIHTTEKQEADLQHKKDLPRVMNALITKKVKELEEGSCRDNNSCEHPEEEFDWLCHTLSFHLASKSFVTRKVYGYPPTAGHGINDCISEYRAQYDEKACDTLQNLIEHYDRKYNTWYPQELEKNITAQKELITVGGSSLENNQNKLRRLLERKLTFSIFCSDADTVRAEQFTKAYLQYYEPEEAA